jgi:hypothetical protein
MNNNTEWQTIHYYQACLEAAERCGLKIEQAGDCIAIIATKAPYVEGTCLIFVESFYAASMWLQGYEQRIFEVKNT